MRNDRLYEAYLSEAQGTDWFEEMGGFWIAVPAVAGLLAVLKLSADPWLALATSLSASLSLASSGLFSLFLSKKQAGHLAASIATGALAVVSGLLAGTRGLAISAATLSASIAAVSAFKDDIHHNGLKAILFSLPFAAAGSTGLVLFIAFVSGWLCLLSKKDIHDSLKPHMVNNMSTRRGVNFVSSFYRAWLAVLGLSLAVLAFRSPMFLLPLAFFLPGLKLRAEASYYLSIMGMFVLAMAVVLWL